MTIAIVAGLIGLAGYIPYVYSTVRGEASPQRASWAVWFVQYTALFCAQLWAGAYEGLWIAGLQLVGVAVMCALSVPYGTGELDPFTCFSVVAAICALVAWYFTTAAVGVVLLIAVEALAVSLTVKKTFKLPYSETRVTWAAFAVAGVLGVVAVSLSQGATLVTYAYPAALCLMALSVLAASYLGAYMQARQAPLKAA